MSISRPARDSRINIYFVEKQAALLHSRPETTQHYARKLHGQANQHVSRIAQRITTTPQHE